MRQHSPKMCQHSPKIGRRPSACHVRKFRWHPPLSFPPPTLPASPVCEALQFHQVSSYFIRFHHISSGFIIFHQVSSYFIRFHHISSGFIIFHQASSYFIRFHHISSGFIIFQILSLCVSFCFSCCSFVVPTCKNSPPTRPARGRSSVSAAPPQSPQTTSKRQRNEQLKLLKAKY